MNVTIDVLRAHRYVTDLVSIDRDCTCGWFDEGGPAVVTHPAHVQAELVRASTVTTEAELNALPEETIIRAEVHREMPSGRAHVLARIYEKRDVRRNEWLELDPSDRDDGDVTVPASLIVNYYGTNGCRILFRPV